MPLVEAALAEESGHHRNPEQLGELGQRFAGAGVEHSLAGPGQRTLGLEEEVGSFGDRTWIGAEADRAERSWGKARCIRSGIAAADGTRSAHLVVAP